MQYTLITEPKVVAVVYDRHGRQTDQCWTWECGQEMARSGYEVFATNRDRYMTIDEAQDIYDAELRWALDCFGEGYAK